MSKLTSFVKKSASEAALALVLVLLPALVVLLKLPETTLAGCPPYGYSCGQVACFALEVTTDGGYTWNEGSVYIYGTPGLEIDVHVRTVLAVLSGGIEGWSFSVRHNTSQVDSAGGSFTLRAVRPEDIYSVRCGSAPSHDSTERRPCGYTQGVVIDSSTSACKLNAPAERVTSSACYRVVMPQTVGVYPVTLEFTNDVGDPPIDSIVTQDCQTKTPCKFNLNLNLYSSNSYYPTQSYCPMTIGDPVSCGGDGGGGGGGLPTVDDMIREGVEFLLHSDNMNTSCLGGPKDHWRWHGSASDGTEFFRAVATTAICAEAILVAPPPPGFESLRAQRLRNATRFLYNNALSREKRCCPPSNVCSSEPDAERVETACEGEAWVSFPLQYFVRLQEVLADDSNLAGELLPDGITIENLRMRTNQIIDAMLDCIEMSDHQSLPRYGFTYVEDELITSHAPFKLAPALLALNRAERFSATQADAPFCFTGSRRPKLNKALDALFRSRVCGQIEGPRIYEPVASLADCNSCNPPDPCQQLARSCIRECEKTTCTTGGCTVGTCDPPSLCDNGIQLHGGAFTYRDRRMAPTLRSLTSVPERASVPGSAGRTPICEAALHAWRWPGTLSDSARQGRIARAIDALFPQNPANAPTARLGSQEVPIYDLYLEALENQRLHTPHYGISVYYFLFAHYSAAMAIETLPPSHPSRAFWRDELVDKLRDVRGSIRANHPHAWHDNFNGVENARNYGTGIALLTLMAPRPRRANLGPCLSLKAPVVPLYKRGDADGNGVLQVTDAIKIFQWLFVAGHQVGCLAALDANDDHSIDISDGPYLTRFLFVGGPPPPAPHPQCGLDLDPGPFTCEEYFCPPSANLSQLPGHQSETTVAINACSEGGEVENVVVISNHWPASTNTLGPGLFRAASWDGGESYPLQGVILETGVLRAGGDPVATFDRHGNLYVTYLGAVDGFPHVAISTDGGATFPLHTMIEEPADRPTITTGPAFGGDPGDVSVWVAWTVGGTAALRAAGARVSGRLSCAPRFDLPFDVASHVDTSFIPSDLAIGPEGEVLVVYAGVPKSGNFCPVRVYTKRREAADPMTQVGFLPSGFGNEVSEAADAESPGGIRLCGHQLGIEAIKPVQFGGYANPCVSWDHTAGRAYVAYLDGQEINPALQEVETRIFLKFAVAPNYNTWLPVHPDPGDPSKAAPIRAWIPPPQQPTDPKPFFEFHQRMDLDPVPGSTQGYLAICWYDTTGDADNNKKCHFHAAMSGDQGQTFTELDGPLSFGESDATGITNQSLYGDYVGIRFRRGVFIPAWSANTPGGGNPDAKAEVFSVRVDVLTE
jgi:hypothetical protein